MVIEEEKEGKEKEEEEEEEEGDNFGTEGGSADRLAITCPPGGAVTCRTGA